MRVFLLTTAMLAVLGLTAPARADIVQANPFFLDLGAEGFGDAHRLLTLQQTPQEEGSTVAGPGGTTMLTGGAIPGADKSAVANAGTLGWNTGANVGLGLNIDVTGNTTGMAVNTVVLTLYNTLGLAVDHFSLASPFTLTNAQVDEQRGNGVGVFNFVLTAAERAQFTADVLANGGAAALFVGLESNMGCASGALSCLTDDGPDSWLAFNQSNPTATPLPGTLAMFGGGLALFGLIQARRRKRVATSVLG